MTQDLCYRYAGEMAKKTAKIPGDDVPDIGDDLSDREEYLNDPAHVDIRVLFPDKEPS